MAILEQGLIGTFTGKMGSLVISKWKNKYVGKSKPKASSKPASAIQLDYRSKFKLIGKFLRQFRSVISAGYQSSQIGRTNYNESMSYNLLNSISGIYPDYKLNYANVKLSEPGFEGDIDGVVDPVLTALPQRKIKLTWKINIDPDYTATKNTDLTYAVFSHAEKQISIESKRITRDKLTMDVSFPGLFRGEVHGWLFFVSADRKFVSNTQYLGKVMVID